MVALRIINTIVWLSMAVYMLPASWSAAFGQNVRRGDPMRLACFATAIVMVGFNLRWLLAPENMWLWQALYVLSAVVGAYIIILARSYGRGPRV